MKGLGDLHNLLNQGHLTTEYAYETPDSIYKFKMKTLTPTEEITARSAASDKHEASGSKSDTDVNVFYAIEVLSRAIATVNDVPLEKVPMEQDLQGLEKRSTIVSGFGEELLLNLWAEYGKMRAKTNLTGSEEEKEQIKK